MQAPWLKITHKAIKHKTRSELFQNKINHVSLTIKDPT